ncbi:MAG TPA: hypothetical protein VMC09_11760 [Anaerolineales bacterium]|nr:hypothetical protein [Anaerolineales bacterium]
MNTSSTDRPIQVTLLAIVGVFFSLGSAIRLGYVIYLWGPLTEYKGHPLYIVLSGVIWFASGMILAWGIWKGRKWAWAATLGVIAAYLAWYWFDRLVVQTPHSNWSFVLIAQLVILAVLLAILFSPRTREYFHRGMHE